MYMNNCFNRTEQNSRTNNVSVGNKTKGDSDIAVSGNKVNIFIILLLVLVLLVVCVFCYNNFTSNKALLNQEFTVGIPANGDISEGLTFKGNTIGKDITVTPPAKDSNMFTISSK